MTEHYHMDKWATALGENGFDKSVRSELAKTKTDYAKTFESLNLPTYKRYIEPLQVFLDRLETNEEPAEAVVRDTLETSKLWYQLIAHQEESRRITALDVTPDDLSREVRDKVKNGTINPQECTILVSEFLPNEYGGQIAIQDDGVTEVYFGRGDEADYSAGENPPQFSATNNNPTRVFRYSFDDSKLRSAIYSAVKATGGIPGYYEFALGCDEDNGVLRSIFLDYRDDPTGIYRPPSAK